MTPTSKVIQILAVNPEHMLMVLCADGSIWWMHPTKPATWTLLTEIDKGKYV